jgi:hypothetical protein
MNRVLKTTHKEPGGLEICTKYRLQSRLSAILQPVQRGFAREVVNKMLIVLGQIHLKCRFWGSVHFAH